MSEIILPDDLYTFEGEPDLEYRSLKQQGAEATAKTIDVVGRLWAEELPLGNAGWRARVQMRLGLGEQSDETKRSLTTIGDYAGIFRTFRLGGEQGLGWSLRDLRDHQPGRLRVFSHHHEWSVKNPDRVRELVASKQNENAMRAYIKEVIAAEKAGLDAPEPRAKDKFTNVIFRVSPEDRELLMTTLDGIQALMEHKGLSLPEQEATRMGEMLMYLCGEWFNASSVVEVDGAPRSVDHAFWVARAAGEKYGPGQGEPESGDVEDEALRCGPGWGER